MRELFLSMSMHMDFTIFVQRDPQSFGSLSLAKYALTPPTMQQVYQDQIT